MEQRKAMINSIISVASLGLILCIIGAMYDDRNFPITFVIGAALMLSAGTWILIRDNMLPKNKIVKNAEISDDDLGF